MQKNENGSGDSIPLNPFKIPAHNDILKLRDEERRANHAKCWIFLFCFQSKLKHWVEENFSCIRSIQSQLP